MATQQRRVAPHVEIETKLPRPVPDGTDHPKGLGRWIDDLLGDTRIRKHVAAEMDALVLRDEEMPEDPPPPPPPVPDGTEPFTRGSDAENRRATGP